MKRKYSTTTTTDQTTITTIVSSLLSSSLSSMLSLRFVLRPTISTNHYRRQQRLLLLSSVPSSSAISIMNVLYVVVVLSLYYSSNNVILLGVDGYSTGAGSCIGDTAAVGGYHLDASNGRQVKTGSLYEGQTTVSIDGSGIQPDFIIPLQTQTDYTFKIATIIEPGFAGLLLRSEASSTDDSTIDLSNFIVPLNLTQMKSCDLCTTPVVGITHTGPEPKMFVQTVLRLNQPTSGAIKVDVTVVGVNDERGSLYGYNQYLFSFAGDAATNTAPLPTGPTTPSPTIDTASLINDITGSFAPVVTPVATTTTTSNTATSGASRKLVVSYKSSTIIMLVSSFVITTIIAITIPVSLLVR